MDIPHTCEFYLWAIFYNLPNPSPPYINPSLVLISHLGQTDLGNPTLKVPASLFSHGRPYNSLPGPDEIPRSQISKLIAENIPGINQVGSFFVLVGY